MNEELFPRPVLIALIHTTQIYGSSRYFDGR